MEDDKAASDKYCVYFIVENPFLNRIKIGKAKNPADRIKSLQTGNPNKLSVYRSVHCGSDELMSTTETFLHRSLRDKNINGEWFNLSLGTVDNICDNLEPLVLEFRKEDVQNEEVLKQAEEKDNIVVENIPNEVNDKKCDLCGRLFKKPIDLHRHKNRKKPCLIKEVSQENINNPNRCVHCGSIFVQHQSLTRHLLNCRIRKDKLN